MKYVVNMVIVNNLLNGNISTTGFVTLIIRSIRPFSACVITLYCAIGIVISCVVCFLYLQVNSRSIAEKSGLKPGDGLLSIAGVPTDGMTHDQAKMEILRAGNELDFFVRR